MKVFDELFNRSNFSSPMRKSHHSANDKHSHKLTKAMRGCHPLLLQKKWYFQCMWTYHVDIVRRTACLLCLNYQECLQKQS